MRLCGAKCSRLCKVYGVKPWTAYVWCFSEQRCKVYLWSSWETVWVWTSIPSVVKPSFTVSLTAFLICYYYLFTYCNCRKQQLSILYNQRYLYKCLEIKMFIFFSLLGNFSPVLSLSNLINNYSFDSALPHNTAYCLLQPQAFCYFN